MAQLPQNTAVPFRDISGLYAWLVEREELAATRPGFVLAYPETGTSYSGLPDRLATLRAGCAINLPVGDLPQHARVGMDTGWVHRATVSPDGTIELSIDNGLIWGIENGVV
jgi:hypothetical protein